MPKNSGFTLIEILVVIAIIAVIGLIALVNLQGFGTEQNLKNAALDLVNVLKNAQINATTSLKCNDKDLFYWQVEFSQPSASLLAKTICQYQDTEGSQRVTVSTKSLPVNIILDGISGSATCRVASLSADNTLTVSFAHLTGQPNFSGFNSCFSLSNELTIDLKDSKKEDIRLSVRINKGGAIYVQ